MSTPVPLRWWHLERRASPEDRILGWRPVHYRDSRSPVESVDVPPSPGPDYRWKRGSVVDAQTLRELSAALELRGARLALERSNEEA